MNSVRLIWQYTSDWRNVVVVAMLAAAVVLIWSYARARAPGRVRVIAALLKSLGFAALAICLLEPMLTGDQAKPGANAFVLMADDSKSSQIRAGDDTETRGEWMKTLLADGSDWQTRLGQDFDVRDYAFDTHLRSVDGFSRLEFQGAASAVTGSLNSLGRRFRELPLAGALLFSDGNSTDAGDINWSMLPPIYPVVPPSGAEFKDIHIENVSVTQTNFETAPVVVRADVVAEGYAGQDIVAVIEDENGDEIERQIARAKQGEPLSYRFQIRPISQGVVFYNVRTFAADDLEASRQASGSSAPPAGVEISPTDEQTLANNTRLVTVDRGGGPYRVLYVSGRPNWEYKYLHRAVQEDEQVQAVGLVRIARKVPRFNFRDPTNQRSNPFFDGFIDPDEEDQERHFDPVLVRLDTEDEEELRDGFPKSPEELYKYHAIVLDDIEADFFTQDQLTLIRNFVSQRGGGLLMLGGPDSYTEGEYDRTPVGDMLPVYLNRASIFPGTKDYNLTLTREGWLEPWVRTRETETQERDRLETMDGFHTLSYVSNIKPGAIVLAVVEDRDSGDTYPALVTQSFGKGRIGSFLLGDLWRWGMRRETPETSDLEKTWRQMIRWMVADVAQPINVEVRPKTDSQASAVELAVRVRDKQYLPLDNATVKVNISLPDGNELELDAEASDQEAGMYVTSYVPKQPGTYRAVISAKAPDGTDLGTRESGWASQPEAEEFARLKPDMDRLREIAEKTGGEIVPADQLDSFVESLSSREAPIKEQWVRPLWHHPLFFLITIVCLAAEWGLRRMKGLP